MTSLVHKLWRFLPNWFLRRWIRDSGMRPPLPPRQRQLHSH